MLASLLGASVPRSHVYINRSYLRYSTKLSPDGQPAPDQVLSVIEIAPWLLSAEQLSAFDELCEKQVRSQLVTCPIELFSAHSLLPLKYDDCA